MREEKNIKKILNFLFWVFLLIIAVTIPTLFTTSVWGIIAGSVPLIIKFAYDSFDGFNLFVNRALLWIFNKDVAWEMKAHFKGNFTVNDLDNIITKTKEFHKINIIQTGEFARTFTIPDIGMVINISLSESRVEEDEFSSYIVLAVQRLFVSFQHSTKTLNILISILNDVVQKCIDVSYSKYEFKTFFVTTNPYFGLFLRRLKVIGTPKVNISYKEKEGANEGQVDVMADKISLVTKDIQSLQAFSRKYITLSSLNLSEA